MTISTSKFVTLVFAGLLAMTAIGCKEKGPFEQAGEEIDEAANTIKNGKESTANKIDDAVDEARDGVKDASKELKK